MASASLQFTPWMLPSLFGAVVAGLTAAVILRRRSQPGAAALLLLTLGAAWWCLAQAVGLAFTTLPAKQLMSKLQYFGITTVPFAWFWFAVRYTGHDAWLRGGRWLLFLLPELATLLLAWTNEWHHLIWESVELHHGAFVDRVTEHGPWFDIHTYYAYGLVFVATVLLAFYLAQARHHRKRLLAGVAAPLFPVALNAVYLSAYQRPEWVDLTPTGLALSSVVMAWALLRHDLLELPPVARSIILEAMRDGVAVLDAGGRIVDMNRAAERILGRRTGDSLPATFAALLDDDLRPGAQPEPADRTLFLAPPDEAREQAYEVSVSPVWRSVGAGLVLVIRDVTERHRLEHRLREAGEALERANQQLERLANTDPLTGLPNRRHFMDTLDLEVTRARRYERPLSIVLLDLDHFKEVNDSHGHAAGDAALRATADAIRDALRSSDIAGRIGGEEFAIALPETESDGALATAERLLESIRGQEHRSPEGTPFRITVSLGIAALSPATTTSESLLHAADLALYRAKSLGRDRVSGTV